MCVKCRILLAFPMARKLRLLSFFPHLCITTSKFLLDDSSNLKLVPAIQEGGILGYLENVPPEESKFHGECFVFDKRVSVTHELRRGSYKKCFGCRKPVSFLDKNGDACAISSEMDDINLVSDGNGSQGHENNAIQYDDTDVISTQQHITCSRCKDALTEMQKIRFEERQRQIDLAVARGVHHIHDPAAIAMMEQMRREGEVCKG
mmetsp:Transcript_7013/g.15187  ORF Transcript_7013/g.15187 Transcript_7013/m.15187 type:complete len:205 (+) Transcript_7013:1236-1850(+)